MNIITLYFGLRVFLMKFSLFGIFFNFLHKLADICRDSNPMKNGEWGMGTSDQDRIKDEGG